MIGSFHISTLTINNCGKNMSLDHGWVFLKAIVKLFKGRALVISQPL
jgi:hypothetical protein